MVTLQRLLFPTLDLCPQVELYVNLTEGSWWSQARSEARLVPGSALVFDTYFNGFSVTKWRRHTTVNQISFEFEAEGDLDAELVLNHPYRAARIVATAAFQSADRALFHIDSPPLDELGEGQLYLKVRANDAHAKLVGGRVTTSDSPVR